MTLNAGLVFQSICCYIKLVIIVKTAELTGLVVAVEAVLDTFHSAFLGVYISLNKCTLLLLLDQLSRPCHIDPSSVLNAQSTRSIFIDFLSVFK